MPPLKPLRIYWDSCVFLSYFSKNYPDRYTNIQTILDEVEASKDSLKIVTSVLAKAEAAYIAEEKTDPADYPNMEAQFDKLWLNTHLVELVEVHDDIALQARSLTRTAFVNGWRRLRANDAIHLGTAVLRCLNRFLSVDRFLDSRCQSRLSSAWRGGIFKASGASRTSQLRPIEFFITN
jgi:predicted nucleic acid-binding protein